MRMPCWALPDLSTFRGMLGAEAYDKVILETLSPIINFIYFLLSLKNLIHLELFVLPRWMSSESMKPSFSMISMISVLRLPILMGRLLLSQAWMAIIEGSPPDKSLFFNHCVV